MTRVDIGASPTPLHLTDLGPTLSELEVAAFERAISFRLPAGYREFLLRFNGGTPKAMGFRARDEAPKVPYASDYFVTRFLSLPSRWGRRVRTDDRLVAPQKHTWELGERVLVVAEDGVGNGYGLVLGEGGGRVVFIDHEKAFELRRAPVMADSFEGWLRSFQSPAEEAASERAAEAARRHAVHEGELPEVLAQQVRLAEQRLPGLEAGLRKACQEVVAAKGRLSLQDDKASRRVFDIAFALQQFAGAGVGLRLADFKKGFLGVWGRKGKEGRLGLAGIAPGFIDRWWEDRKASGFLRVEGEVGAIPAETLTALLGGLSRA